MRAVDPFAELFRALRVKGAVYFAQDFAAPWGLRLPRSPHAQVHVVLDGSCSVRLDDQQVSLRARDVVLFPNGAPHVIADPVGDVALDVRAVFRAIRAGQPPFAGPPGVRLLSGHFEFDRAAGHPLLLNLPDFIHVGGVAGSDAAVFDTLLPILAAEAAARRPGAETIVERLAEIFLVQVLRVHFGSAQPEPGLLAALFDPRLHAAVALIHARSAEQLTLADLARAAGMSRSAFAAHFRATALMSPMAYLARWRLLRARELLAARRLSVSQVAAACGHRSTEGFSRAFRRAYGESPTVLRASGGAPS